MLHGSDAFLKNVTISFLGDRKRKQKADRRAGKNDMKVLYLQNSCTDILDVYVM